MDVLYCFDEGYSRVVATSMISFARFHENTTFHMFTLGPIKRTTSDEMKRIADKYHSSVTFYNVTNELMKYKELYQDRDFNLGMLARLLASECLPETVDTLLYLDGDTLIVSELNEDDLNPKEYYVLGVYDNSLPPMGVKRSIGFEKNELYVNSGVMVINLKKWREYRFDKLFYNFFSSRPNVILWDQDAINYLCKGHIGLLPLSYNLTFITQEIPYEESKKLFEPYTYNYYSKEDFEIAQKNPKIIHFAGEVLGKPWTNVSYIKFTNEWREIDKETIWGTQPYYERKYANTQIKTIYKKFCERLIADAYAKKNYGRVCVLYNFLYKIPHRLQSLSRRLICLL